MVRQVHLYAVCKANLLLPSCMVWVSTAETIENRKQKAINRIGDGSKPCIGWRSGLGANTPCIMLSSEVFIPLISSALAVPLDTLRFLLGATGAPSSCTGLRSLDAARLIGRLWVLAGSNLPQSYYRCLPCCSQMPCCSTPVGRG